MQEWCGHKLLNILLQVFAKYVSTRDPGSAISPAGEIMPAPSQIAQKQSSLLFKIKNT